MSWGKAMETMETGTSLYRCIRVDINFSDIVHGLKATTASVDRDHVISQLQDIWTSPSNSNRVLPALSVRTAFDLFLRVKNFPPGSEIIMSAINIPSMVELVKHHGLVPVPLDINLETMEPKVALIDGLISDQTVCLLVAHLYGKRVEMDPFVKIAKKFNIHLVEDCAESFAGFDWTGHPESDLALFSFGVLKYYSAAGGAIAKIRNRKLYEDMVDHYKSYPVQSPGEFRKKLVKVLGIWLLTNKESVSNTAVKICRKVGYDYQKFIIDKMRGFPRDLIASLRFRPSDALLAVMLRRFTNFTLADFQLIDLKGDYLSDNLPEQVTQVGNKAHNRHYWLFPILVEYPDEFVKRLFALGVDCYRSASQLNIIEPAACWSEDSRQGAATLQHFVTHYPHEAKYLMDQLVYLPFHKHMSFQFLDHMCKLISVVLQNMSIKSLPPPPLNTQIKAKL